MQADASCGAAKSVFDRVAFKRLSAVETDRARSNQHEFNGSRALLKLFGEAAPQRIGAEFVWMRDDGDFMRADGLLTWYDARARHPTRCEYRLYYVDNPVTQRAATGDLLLIARKPDDETLVLLAPGSGVAAVRIAYLFGIETAPGAAFAALNLDEHHRQELNARFAVKPVNEGGWTAEPAVGPLQTDQSIRSAILKLQSEIGSDRSRKSTNSWAQDDS